MIAANVSVSHPASTPRRAASAGNELGPWLAHGRLILIRRAPQAAWFASSAKAPRSCARILITDRVGMDA